MNNPTIGIFNVANNELGEGPHWSESEERLYWVDIAASVIHSMTADGSDFTTRKMNEFVGAVVPCRDGGLLAAMASGIYRVVEGLEPSLIASPELNVPDNRFNDGKCDSHGRFWVGSLSMQSLRGAGCLWKIDKDGHSQLMESGLDISNGLGWSPDDRTFYFTDSGQSAIFAYDHDAPNGEITNRRLFAKVATDDGVPDGLTVDADGFVWSARWDGSCIVRYDPDGKVERKIEFPVLRPTSCVLGGASGSTLFVTSARIGLSDAQLAQAPDSGSVFALDVPATALPECQFG